MSSSEGVKQTLNQVANLYSENLGSHGATPRSLGWRDIESQQLRFEKLAQVLYPDDESKVSVGDLGCGYAAMFTFLKDKLGTRLDRYYGYDLSPEMLAQARIIHGDSNLDLIESSQIEHKADFIFVSGTFNVRFESCDDEWRSYILEVLEEINSKSTRGFAFNLLSTYVDWREDHLYYGDPLFFFDHCKRHFSKQVSLLHDYPLYEWTMIVRK